MDVSKWLRDLGLENYAQAFHANDIDAEVLHRLTADDLVALGVRSVGHRRKLLDAIAALDQARAAAAAEPTAAPIRPLEAERRQLTVLFCDLVGSTELAARVDPEELSGLIRAYQNTVAGEIARFEGHTAKYMGDGVLAYFGWPQAHEDEAERAVRAGLAITGAVTALKTPLGQTFSARIGIATGPVVVGELIGDGSAQEQAVVGETPNLAARLQAIAAPGRVVISQATRRLVGGLFELTDLGPQRLKGFTKPVRAWGVAGEGRAEGRFEALRGRRLTPLVGREHELALLMERWSWARQGDGQVVLLSGEPGIGKSRLVRALRERLAAEPHTPISHFCSPYHVDSALQPVIGLLERAAGLAPEDTTEQRLDRLAALLARSTDRLDEAVPFLAALLSIPTGERYPPLDLSPQRQKQRTLEVLLDQLAGLAAREPVLAVYEDVQWVDPTTLELLDLVVERVRRMQVLVLITFRPEFDPPWSGQAHVAQLPLNRLGRRQGAAIVERLTGGKSLPDEILEQIVAKTDGVPLFLEELTKTILESGLLTDAGTHHELTGRIPSFAIPATLHDSLMARLDRLASIKEVAQIGAVIGREFDHALLAAASPLPDDELGHALDQLVASELIFRRGTPPAATYTFKHALVQDAAYESLLRSRRQQFHARIGEVLEQRFPKRIEAGPELLARHFTEAGWGREAVPYWQKAGERAAQRSANLEAVSHLRRGLEVAATVPDEAWAARTELELQLALGTPLIAIKGYTADDTVAAFARARELCEQLGEVSRLFQAIYGMWANHAMRAEHERARRLAEEFLSLAEHHGAVGPTITAHRVLGWSLSLLGELPAGRDQLEQALALYDPDEHRTLAYCYGQDPRIAALSILAWNIGLLGYPDTSRALTEEALREAEELNHAFTRAYATYVAGAAPRYLSRDFEGSKPHVDELIAFSQQQGFPFWTAYGTALLGALLAHDRREEDAMMLAEQALADLDRLGLGWFLPFVLYSLANGMLASRNPDRASKLIAQSLAIVDRTGERWIEPELQRLNGEVMLLDGRHRWPEAERCFRCAIELARAQAAKSLELRTAISLARLWAEHGEERKAYDLLAPIYGWFTEGFDTADLKAAKALLDELA